MGARILASWCLRKLPSADTDRIPNSRWRATKGVSRIAVAEAEKWNQSSPTRTSW
jgi:hypothetical protein